MFFSGHKVKKHESHNSLKDTFSCPISTYSVLVELPRIGRKKARISFVHQTSDNLMDDLPGTLGVFQTVYRRHKGLTLANVYAKNVCKLMIMAEVNSKVGAGNDTGMKY